MILFPVSAMFMENNGSHMAAGFGVWQKELAPFHSCSGFETWLRSRSGSLAKWPPENKLFLPDIEADKEGWGGAARPEMLSS